jgi:hypothetical protein
MTTTVRIGGGTTVAVAALADVLGASGYEVVPDAVSLDVAVFLDTERAPALLTDASPADWLGDVVGGMSDAFSFARSMVPRLASSSGGLVFSTSLAGQVGVPGRSVDAVVAGGIVGLARSLLHDVPSIWVMLLMESLPRPLGARPSADVAWELEVSPTGGEVPTAHALARSIRWATGSSPPAGTLITCMKGAVGG